MRQIITVIMLIGLLAVSGCNGDGNTAVTGNFAAASKGVPFPPRPDSDPFYQAPNPLPDLPAGSILKSRAVTFAPELGIPLPLFKAWQLQFISHDSHGRRIAAIATVVKPLNAATANTRLLAYQYATDSLGTQCSVSRTLTGGTANFNSQLDGLSALPGLLQGWTVVYPNHQGPNMADAAGRLAGHITLDSIRAAEHFKPLGLNKDTRVAMWGYSGGAIATAWAATLQASYAPKLNIVAIASGGTPADLIAVAKNVDTNLLTNTAFFSLIFSAIIGVNREYPNLITPILNDKGRAAAKALANGCLGATTGGAPTPTGHFADYTTVSNPFAAPSVKAVAPEISLPQPDSFPVADTFVYHSILDELIPIAGADNMVKSWCADGATVHYYRGFTGEHITFAATMTPFVLAYLNSRLAQQPAVLPPGTTSCN